MDDLVVFLRERLAEDEQVARKATARQTGGETWTYDGTGVQAGSGLTVAQRQVPVLAEHIARHDPARVLAEIETKRRMIDECERTVDYDSRGMMSMAEDFLRLLALPYAEHPEHREEWRP